MPPVIAQCDHTITFIDCILHNLLVMSIKLLKQSTVKMENNNLPEGLCQINDYPFPPEACLAGNMHMHNLYLWVKQHPPQKLKQGTAKLKELLHLAATASWRSNNMVERIVEYGVNTLDTRNATTHWPIGNSHS